jgi:hypothetical protein
MELSSPISSSAGLQLICIIQHGLLAAAAAAAAAETSSNYAANPTMHHLQQQHVWVLQHPSIQPHRFGMCLQLINSQCTEDSALTVQSRIFCALCRTRQTTGDVVAAALLICSLPQGTSTLPEKARPRVAGRLPFTHIPTLVPTARALACCCCCFTAVQLA